MSTRGRDWQEIAERGSIAGIWFLVVMSTIAGRAPARAFLRLIAPYYLLFHGPARRASRSYLARVLGSPDQATLRRAHDHLLRFAQCTFDRLFFVRGKVDLFDVESHGHEHLAELVDREQGALLLGAHLGSFEAMQRMADARAIPVNIVGFFRNARMFNAVLEKLNPECNTRLIELDSEDINFVLRIRDRVRKGELVAILADRTWPEARSAVVDFFGAPARFPTGAYLLASALGCPVYLTFGLHTPPNRYDLHCELFAEKIELPRKGAERVAALREQAQRYAQRLEHYCRLAPDNWFNFYDFWDSSEGTGS